jgi:tetraacyldisaccharide 4'-kinase
MLKHVTGATALSGIHRLVVWGRNRSFDKGKRKIWKLDRPVVSVGNITVGGTGKTPFTMEIARLLSGEGYVTCVLSRGYGGIRSTEPLLVSDLRRIHHGATEAGDEPFLMARHLPGIAVVVGADRHAAAQLAMAKVPVQAFVLDDGFQHRSLHRDLDIVMVDAADAWGGGELLPAGRLREPPSALARAHGIVLTRLHQVTSTAVATLRTELARHAPGVPVLTTRTFVTGLKAYPGGRRHGVEELRGKRVLAFSGIARPEAFFADVDACGAHLVARRAFPDHHSFSPDDMLHVARTGNEVGATALVTTEKDAVRLPLPFHDGPPVFVLRQRVLPEDPAALMRLLASHMPGHTRGGKSLD